MALGITVQEIIESGEFPLLTKHDSWQRVYLKDIASIQNGYAFSSDRFTKNEGMPLIRIRDIGNNKTQDFYNGEYPIEYIVHRGDVLIGMDGDFNLAIWKGGEALLNQRVCRLICTNKQFSSKFLVYALPCFLKAINTKTSSVTVKHLSSKTIEDIPLPLPPLAEQHRIVAKIEELFSELDKGIETLKTAQQQLKVYRQAVLKYAFEGKLTNPDVKEGELPEGWVRAALGAVVIKSVAKAYPDKNSKFTFLGMDSIEPNSTKPHLFYKFSDMKSSGNLYYSGQVLYGRMRPYLNKVWVADNNGVASGEFIVLSCRESILPKYLLNILHHQDFVNFANSKTSGDRPRISFDEICEFQLVIPQISEQHAILHDIDVRMTVCEKIEESINQGLQQAEVLRQSILKKAFEGKLLPQDPNDEPASVLLDRIKAARAVAQPEKKTRTRKIKV
jgi:type I restriction enzyme S subunit